jgi:hypothetical protein
MASPSMSSTGAFVEQAAVEVAQLVLAKVAAIGHRLKQLVTWP